MADLCGECAAPLVKVDRERRAERKRRRSLTPEERKAESAKRRSEKRKAAKVTVSQETA